MNCKPGDLAVVVRAPNTPEMLGRLVICERIARHGDRFGGARFTPASDAGIAWAVRATAAGELLPWPTDDGLLEFTPERPFGDEYLRPIRPNEGEDESLSWAKPRVEESV